MNKLSQGSWRAQSNCIKYSTIFLPLILFCSCQTLPKSEFDYPPVQSSPDYHSLSSWAAHPEKIDSSDRIPARGFIQLTKELPVDVFFIHPTTYIGRSGENKWNAEVQNAKLNQRTDETTIRFQASIFNTLANVYAPRYRQAHLHVYYTKKKDSAQKALHLAYQDVRRAFKFYLQTWNKGKPFIIASHSQGTSHAGPLIREFIDGKELQKQLIGAYLVGMPVPKDYFEHIPPCEEPNQTGCFTSWRTFKKGYIPRKHPIGDSILVTNPLTWKNNNDYASNEFNQGTLLYKFNEIYHGLVDAQATQGLLWATKPKFPGSLFLWTRNYHIADLNFYYFNVKQNAALRSHTWFQNHQ